MTAITLVHTTGSWLVSGRAPASLPHVPPRSEGAVYSVVLRDSTPSLCEHARGDTRERESSTGSATCPLPVATVGNRQGAAVAVHFAAANLLPQRAQSQLSLALPSASSA